MKHSLNYPIKNSLSLFHANVNGRESHFDELIISDANLKYNAICISETSQKDTAMFKRNVNLDNLHPIFSTGTKSAIYVRNIARGGSAIYVKNTHNTIVRIGLKSCNQEFESICMEIKNQKSKNIIIGCMYRHPHPNNLEEFNLYVKNTLLNNAKENK